MSETAVVECQRCGQQCTRGFSKGEEDQDFQNLLVHEMVVHNSTMPELAHVFRTQDASESKELLDKAIKQAPTHQKACSIALMYAFHMRVNKPEVRQVSSIIDMAEGLAEAGSSEITPSKGWGPLAHP